MAYIYKITNLLNSKVYIGKTINDPKRRWAEHKYESRKEGHGYYYPIHGAMRKYGIDNFKFEVIENCKEEECFQREAYYIKLYDSTNKDKGYNIVVEGEGGVRYSSEEILDLWKQGLSASNIAKKIGAHGYPVVTNRLKGLGITQEEIIKRQGAETRKRCSMPVLQYTLDGVLIKRWDSATQCMIKGYHQSAISSVCRQQQKSAYGFLWKYEEDNRDIQEWVKIVSNKLHAGKPKKRIKQISLDGKIVNTFESATEAAKFLNLKSKSYLCSIARKKGKAYGYYWEYE